MTHTPVCTACGVFMRCKKNGYIVGTQGMRRWDSDRYECPDCEASIAILANKPHPQPPINGEPVHADTILRKDQ